MDQEPWQPQDTDTNAERENTLYAQVIELYNEFSSSDFANTFLEQVARFKTEGTFPDDTNKFKIVVYGLGSFENMQPSRLQLCLVRLMKDRLDWIDEVELFDPVFSLTEVNLLTRLEYTVLFVNESGRRLVDGKPCIFYMPYCERFLYENLVKTNWNCDHLEKVVVIGNSLIQWVLKEYNPTSIDDEEEDYEEGDDEDDGCEEGDDEEEDCDEGDDEEDCDEGDDEDEEEEEDDEEGETAEVNLNCENILKLSEDTEPPIRYIRAAKDYIQEFQIATFSNTEFLAFDGTYWSFFKVGKDNGLPHVDD